MSAQEHTHARSAAIKSTSAPPNTFPPAHPAATASGRPSPGVTRQTIPIPHSGFLARHPPSGESSVSQSLKAARPSTVDPTPRARPRPSVKEVAGASTRPADTGRCEDDARPENQQALEIQRAPGLRRVFPLSTSSSKRRYVRATCRPRAPAPPRAEAGLDLP